MSFFMLRRLRVKSTFHQHTRSSIIIAYDVLQAIPEVVRGNTEAYRLKFRDMLPSISKSYRRYQFEYFPFFRNYHDVDFATL